MRFTYHPLTSVVIAAATWLSLIPLAPLVQGRSYLIEAALPLIASALIGLLLAVLRAPRLLTLLAQTVALAAILTWRGLALSPLNDGPWVTLRALISEGLISIREGVPPIEATPGLLFLCLVLAALLVLVLELLVNALEQAAWAIAPLALVFGLSALIVREDLSWLYALPVVAAYVMVLLAATGLPSEATGKASNMPAYQASRISVGAAAGAAMLALALFVATMVPLGAKQPWNQAGPDGPIQLTDPTVRLNEDLRRPQDNRILTYSSESGEPVYLRTVALPDLSESGARLVPMRLARFGFGNAYDGPGDEVRVDVTMDVESEYLPAPFAAGEIDADEIGRAHV